jgi:hypothetical protein
MRWMTSISVVLRAVEEGSRSGFEKRQHVARLLAAGGKRCTQKEDQRCTRKCEKVTLRHGTARWAGAMR